MHIRESNCVQFYFCSKLNYFRVHSLRFVVYCAEMPKCNGACTISILTFHSFGQGADALIILFFLNKRFVFLWSNLRVIKICSKKVYENVSALLSIYNFIEVNYLTWNVVSESLRNALTKPYNLSVNIPWLRAIHQANAYRQIRTQTYAEIPRCQDECLMGVVVNSFQLKIFQYPTANFKFFAVLS